MISTKFRIILFVLLIGAFILMMRFIRKRELRIKYSLVWILIETAVFLILIFPQGAKVISEILGIYNAANMLLFVAIICVMLICFSLTVALSRLADRNARLVQKIGIYERELRIIKEHINTGMINSSEVNLHE